jgi:Domain of unknown function (DUF4349)
MRNSTRRVRLWVGGAVLATLVCAGCSSSGGGGGSTSGAGEPGGDTMALGAARSEPAKAGEASLTGQAPVRTRSVVRTYELSLTAVDLEAVRREIDALLKAVGGSVDKEDSTSDKQGRIDRSTLTLRVPVAAFASTKKALEGLGTLESSSATEKDVTTAVIDVAERVQTLQNSLDRLQRFQRTAGDVGDLIRYEDQITSRQAELQSLKAQQAYLADQTSMSTLTVHLSTPRTTVGALDDAGFLSGLRGGWDALTGFAVVMLTVLGAVLPFLVVLVVLGVPTWLVWRLARRREVAPPAEVTGD